MKLYLNSSSIKYGICSFLFLITFSSSIAQQNIFDKSIIFPLQNDHVHGSTIVELSNGDLLVGWFQGSGERWADDVQIMGSRKKNGSDKWSEPFVLADVKEFPDINPILFVDGKDRLWLMWYTVIANQWETSLIKYRISEEYLPMAGPPVWDWQEDLHIKPGDKAERGILPGDSFVQSVKEQLDNYIKKVESSSNPEIPIDRLKRRAENILSKARGENMVREGRIYKDDGTYDTIQLGYPYFRRMGWQTRSKPYLTSSGRMIVPLYSDGFGFSLMAFSDDWGDSWEFSNPLVGGGNIQPAIAETKSGELVAYMRDNGGRPKRLHISRSKDNGKSWSNVEDTELPNPGSAADIVTLKNGNWVLIYNDLERGRHNLTVALSEDAGKTWPWKKKIEDDESPTQSHYPAIIEGKNGVLHASYSYFLPETHSPKHKTIKYSVFTEDWIRGK